MGPDVGYQTWLIYNEYCSDYSLNFNETMASTDTSVLTSSEEHIIGGKPEQLNASKFSNG